MRRICLLLSTIVIASAIVGCNDGYVSTKVTISDYQPKEYYAGIRTIFKRKTFEYHHKLFYEFHDEIRVLDVPFSVYDVAICPFRKVLYAIAFDGVIELSFGSDTYSWIFKDPMHMIPYGVFDTDRRWLLLMGSYLDGEEANSKVKYYLNVINLRTLQRSTYGVTSYIKHMFFYSRDKAIVTAGEDLIKINLSENGDHKLIIEKGLAKAGQVYAMYHESPVYYSDRTANPDKDDIGKTKIVFDNKIIPFEHGLWMVYPFNSQLRVVEGGGLLYDIDFDGKKTLLDSIQSKIIGVGELRGKGIWVATDDGVVRTYGDQKRRETISLPDFSSSTKLTAK